MSGQDNQALLTQSNAKNIDNNTNNKDEESLLPKKRGIDWEFVWEEVKWYCKYSGPVVIFVAIVVIVCIFVIVFMTKK